MNLKSIFALAEEAVDATTSENVSRIFADVLERAGASYFQARLYRRPDGQLTSPSHWQAGGVVLRRAANGWVGSTGFNFICFEKNPLLVPIRQSLTRYRFSDFAPRHARAYRDYWDAFSHARIEEGICATAYGPDRSIASIHVGLPTRDLDPAFTDSVSIAASLVAEKIMTFAEPRSEPSTVVLSARERDTLGLVAEGKTDWEIAVILGISDTTARFHVDNARRKLNAVNRSHAVARYIASYGSF